eukprot:COSAG02_NODE_2731_length_8142_cov_5.041775_3_plen_72_part_00
MAAEEELFDPPVTSEEAAALPPAAAAIRPTRRQLSAAFESPRFVEKNWSSNSSLISRPGVVTGSLLVMYKP